MTDTTHVIAHMVIPDDCLKEIGRVAVAWNQFEGVLDFVLIKLIGRELTDDRSHVIFTHTGVQQRFDILRSLLVALIKDEKHWYIQMYDKEISPLLKAAKNQRNNIIHSKWSMDEKGKLIRMDVTARGVLKFSAIKMSVKELEKIPDDILRASNSLFTFITHGPLPGQPGPTESAITKFLADAAVGFSKKNETIRVP